MNSTTTVDFTADTIDLVTLNKEFAPLSVDDRIRRLYDYIPQQEVMMTTSFGTKSIYLLHHIYRLRPEQTIYFLDTKYHFESTYQYKEQVRSAYNLKLTYIYPDTFQNQLTTDEKWWNDHPRMCCTVNKIAPLEPIIQKHSVWISGLMASETEHRSRLNIFERQGDIIKFSPMIDTTQADVQDYINAHNLPRHPEEKNGYGSIGCTHCTHKGENRSGRWSGTSQKECGIHLKQFIKK